MYSLGATLYECLTLSRPFEAATREGLYRKILTESVSKATDHNPHIPADLQLVLETALEKDPGRRYQTALDLAEDLRRVLTPGSPSPLRAASPPVRPSRFAARRSKPSNGFCCSTGRRITTLTNLATHPNSAA